MITVQLNKAGFEYDIHSLVKAFFPAEDVLVCVGEPKEQSGVSFHIVTDYLEHCIRTVFYEAGGQGRAPMQEQSVEVDFSDRRETKNRLKQVYYKMLCAYTKKTLPWGDLTGIRPVKIPMAFLEEGKDEAFIRKYMQETYFVSDEKIRLSIEVAKRELALLRKIDYVNGYSLYIGIPFCPSTCLYCSFTSFPFGAWEHRADQYLDALERELLYTARQFGGRQLNTVYIGGGTPTTLTAAQLRRLVGMVQSNFDLSGCLEFTVEAGRPDSITEDKLLALRELGISRISINPQTMKEETLQLIGRRHTVQQAVDSFWLSPDNLTVHSLALKRAARLTMFREEYQGLSFENTWETIDLTARYAKEMGMAPYYLYRQKNMAGNFENVGYAKEGKAGIYNVLIMEEKQTIVAVGAGSISKRVYPDGRIERCENVKDVSQYIARIGEMIERKTTLLSD